MFADTACVALREDASRSSTIVTCQHVTTAPGENLDVRGEYIPVTTVDEILAALGETELPNEGLVIGRVVDHTGQALPGVAVTPVVGGATVQYLNASRTAFIGVETSPSAYFVSTDTPFDARWRAEHDDGRREDGEYRAGLIRDKITLVRIQMQAPQSVVTP
jgi:hypothetical protein